jgi:hypothetical protein
MPAMIASTRLRAAANRKKIAKRRFAMKISVHQFAAMTPLGLENL